MIAARARRRVRRDDRCARPARAAALRSPTSPASFRPAADTFSRACARTSSPTTGQTAARRRGCARRRRSANPARSASPRSATNAAGSASTAPCSRTTRWAGFRTTPTRSTSPARAISLRVSLSETGIDLRRGRKTVREIPIAVGRAGTETPAGRFQVTDKLPASRFPAGPYGCCIIAAVGPPAEPARGLGRGRPHRHPRHDSTGDDRAGRVQRMPACHRHRPARPHARRAGRRSCIHHPVKVGLVLGAGGVMGGAWLTGGLEALARETGWDPGSADYIVGTSAGSMMGSLLASGIPPWFMVAHSAGEVFEGSGPGRPRRRGRRPLRRRGVPDRAGASRASAPARFR